MGESCCIDLMGATQFTTSRTNWDKQCCDNQRGPFVEVTIFIRCPLTQPLSAIVYLWANPPSRSVDVIYRGGQKYASQVL